jgi:hypothetical protein
MLHPIIKSWLFHGWVLDFVGRIHPASSKGYRFVLVATDYFTKWAEAVPLKIMTHKEVIRFISEHIIHRFGIPQMLTIDQGSLFMSHQVSEFAESLKIKLLSSSPYYAQANGQAESSNKTLIKLIKKKIEENPKRWHEVLSEVLWAHRISKHSTTKVTPFELVYGQEVYGLGMFRASWNIPLAEGCSWLCISYSQADKFNSSCGQGTARGSDAPATGCPWPDSCSPAGSGWRRHAYRGGHKVYNSTSHFFQERI